MTRPPRSDLPAPALAALGVAICCGAPLALAFILTTGLGAALVARAWPLVGLGLMAAG